MKKLIYVLTCCYTEDSRGACGYMSHVSIYKDRKEAVRSFTDMVQSHNELHADDAEIEMVDLEDDNCRVIAKSEYNAIAWDEGGNYCWELREFEISNG